MDANDRMTAAIQAYAETLPNPELSLNLLAAAEHMAPALIGYLGLQQEWALIDVEKYDEREEINEVRFSSDSPTLPYNELEHRRELDDLEGTTDDRYCREYVGSRLYTDWAEEHPIILNADEQRQMDIDQGVVPAT